MLHPDADNDSESNFNLSGTHNVDAFADKLYRRKGHTDTQHNQIATRKAARKKFSPAEDSSKRPHAQEDTPPAPANKRTKKIAGPKQHKWTLIGAFELDILYSTIGLLDMNVKGDGNCLLYAAMGIDGHNTNHPQQAARIRQLATLHAKSRSPRTQESLKADERPSSPQIP